MFIKPFPISPIDEERLIAGCLARDRSSQSQVYKLYAPAMLKVCYRYAKSKEDAEEILQEGFIRVFKFIGQFKNNGGSFEGWMKKIMINCTIRRYRNQLHLHPVVSLDAVPVDFATDEDVLNMLSSKELIELIQMLPTSARMVFNLFVFEGFKHREIAAMLKISEGTSKSNLSDARMILKKLLHNRYHIAK